VNVANNRDPDLLTFDQARVDVSREYWIQAAQNEISELEAHGSWVEVPESEAKGRILPSTWVFKKKRAPDGSIKKFKARICLRGDLMEGVSDTFSPVVAFSTVRVFFIMSLLLEWKTCTVDFSNAFVQATRTDEVWMHVPRGFKPQRPRHVLKLIKSLYGAKDAPKLWSDHLFEALRLEGFIQSKIDPCLWMKPTIYLICFVDDCGIAYKEEEDIIELIKSLETRGFQLTREKSFAEYLGIKYEKLSNGNIELTQQGLIQKIIKATGLENCNPNRTPATKEALGIDPEGQPMREQWDYQSIVGMLLYLSTNTRPDIIFSVSQVARFNHAPKQTHAQAVKRIVRYLFKTSTKGTILRPHSKLTLQCFVDADFAGLFKIDPDSSITSAKSRSGYLIKLSNCPLIGKSQLQPTIALSTAEAEYYALSQAMRAVIPIRELILDLVENVNFPERLNTVRSSFHASVFEDNTSALTLATDQRLTNRTRHYHCRWHHFWTNVSEGEIEVVFCETANQQADYLTKGSTWEPFEHNRKDVQGW
jgi:hypothetical protein